MLKDFKGGAPWSQGEAFDPSPSNIEVARDAQQNCPTA